jgi:hypothetical protein
VLISCPEAATPMMTLTPQPRWQHSSLPHRLVLPMHSKQPHRAGELHEVVDQVLMFLRVDEVGHAELARQRLARRVQVDADDLVGADHLRALNHVQADAAEAEHHHVGAGLDLGREQHRADTGGDAAADVADLVEGCVLAIFGQRSRARRCGCKGAAPGNSGLPPMEKRLVESGISPLPCVARIAVHRLVLRDRQLLHCRHSGVYSGITWSPALSDVTPAPTSSTTPAPSWPRIDGNSPSESAPDSV